MKTLATLLSVVFFAWPVWGGETPEKIISSFQTEEKLFQTYTQDETGRKALAATRHQYAHAFLEKTKVIDIREAGFSKALLYAESATRLDPSVSAYWLVYALLLTEMPDMQNAQIAAEGAAKTALGLNPGDNRAKMVLLQSYVNQFQFHQAMEIINEILASDPILMNHPTMIYAYLSCYAFAGEPSDGSDYLHGFLLLHPANYGAMIAQVKLYQMQMRDGFDVKGLKRDIQKMKKDLARIRARYGKKISPGILVYLESILGKESK